MMISLLFINRKDDMKCLDSEKSSHLAYSTDLNMDDYST